MVDQIIRPADLPNRANPVASEKVPVDNGVTVGGATIQSIVESGRPAASQSEAEAGINAEKAMTPLTSRQGLLSQIGVTIASKAQGDRADSAVQPADLATVATTGSYNDLTDKPTLSDETAAESRAWAISNLHPISAPTFIRTAGYGAPGDGGGALYKLVVSEPSHPGKFSITLDDGVTVAWYEIAETEISPIMIGGMLGVGADQSASISATFDVARAIGASVYFPAGNWRQDTAISKSYALDIELHPDAVINCDQMPNGAAAWTFSGALSPTIGASGAAVEKGSTTLQFSTGNAALISPDDWIILRANNVFDASRTNTMVGEINRVISVNTGTGVVDLYWPTQSRYSTGRLVEIITPIHGMRVRGGRFVGQAGDTNKMNAKVAISIALALDPIVEGVSFERFDHAHLRLQNVQGGTTEKCYFGKQWPASTGYGITFYMATQDCVATNNRFYNCRHALSTNNSGSIGGIPRRLIWSNNNIFYTAIAGSGSMTGGDAVDTHAAAEDITIIGNTIIGATGGGINVEAPSCTVVNNTILNSAGGGISVRNESDVEGVAVVSGNRVFGSGLNGIYIYNGIGGATSQYISVVCANNIVERCGNFGIQINLVSSARNMRGVVISGNSVRNFTLHGIIAASCPGVTLNNNNVTGNATGDSLRIDQCQGFVVNGNNSVQPDTATGRGIFINAPTAGASSNGIITSNRCGSITGAVVGNGIQMSSNVQYTVVANNNVRGTAGLSLGSGTGNEIGTNIT